MEKIETKIGEKFQISLKANISTGYRWYPHFDSNQVSLVERRYKSARKIIGVNGLDVFSFLAMKRGMTEIEMILKRPWSKEFLSKEIFQIVIK